MSKQKNTHAVEELGLTQTHLPPQWRERLLAVLAAKLVPENLRLLDAWSRAEGGSAQWNPLNTTYGLAGSTKYNDANVRNFRYPVEGICATAITFVGRSETGTLRYGGILGDLQTGTKVAEDIVRDRASEFGTWGTDVDVILQVLQSG